MEKKLKKRRYWLVPKNKCKKSYVLDRYNIDFFEDLLEVIELTLDTAIHQVGRYYLSGRPEFLDGHTMRFLVQWRTIGTKSDDSLTIKLGQFIYINKTDYSVLIDNDISNRSLIVTKNYNNSYFRKVFPIHENFYKINKTENKTENIVKKGIDICNRCDGGNLVNCPICNGKGFIDSNLINKSKISLRAGSYNLDNYTSPHVKVVAPTNVPDHESIHRSDPKDASRLESTSIRDRGKFGSSPLYDNFDE